MDQQSRTTYYVKPGFQRKMMIIIILVVAIAANLVGALCYGLISHTLQTELMDPTILGLEPGQIPYLEQKLFQFMFPKVLLAELITILLLALMTLRLTHHIAGPVYRLEQNMEEMAKGNLNLRTSFRSRDEFTELAQALNELGDSYCRRLDRISEIVADLEYTDLSPEQQKALDKMKEYLKKQAEVEV